MKHIILIVGLSMALMGCSADLVDSVEPGSTKKCDDKCADIYITGTAAYTACILKCHHVFEEEGVKE